jgi:hypothetical protein
MKLTTYEVGGQEVKVIDDAFDYELLLENYKFVRKCPFYYFDYSYFDDPDAEFPVGNGTQWIHPLKLEETEKYPIFSSYEKLIKANTGFASVERSHINCHFFGDNRNPHIDKGQINGLLFLTPEWIPEWGGEIIFYEKRAPRLTLEPIPGRLVIFDGSILHKGGTPSKSSTMPRYTLTSKFLKA